MTSFSRRNILGSGGALLSGALATSAFGQVPSASTQEPFSFLFITDTHLQPELDAMKGCQMAFRSATREKADFVLQGGDHVYDAMEVSMPRARRLLDLYEMTEQELGMKVYHTVGNHDCFGVYAKSGASVHDPDFGKNFFRKAFGETYYAFQHKGVHFIVLDSVTITPDRDYEGRFDARQVEWLGSYLRTLPATAPIIVCTHIPMVTAFYTYADESPSLFKHQALSTVNTREILALMAGHNVLAVFQGHTHVLEQVEHNGIQFITGGAVSGNWWHGRHLGTPEGYMVVHVENNAIRTEYKSFGFKTVSPQNTY
ncbi:metallophosphoesterase family protein [Gluconacetobacter sacchari]|uniref:Metallophosphoesterase n=2 Tax=Gluconacetobacter sacchari TaxID=92759 RepID=A0A7W4ICG5_9PROT|nr:metallophosphoesterase [Gluconacetobacter sacchari]MBB2160336.1 metallophosphoesterase [Gluconacetobacter sacchari]GBQ25358.1 metallophosphoesterase [Gluconacetobacter sacchari DSM 12717]